MPYWVISTDQNEQSKEYVIGNVLTDKISEPNKTFNIVSEGKIFYFRSPAPFSFISTRIFLYSP